MTLLRKIADRFNGTAAPSERAVRSSIKRMTTREGRVEHMKMLARHPKHINVCDKHQKSALYRAAEAGDTEVMSQLMDAGIMPYFYHDAIYAAAHGLQREAFELLLAKGAVVGDDHIDVTQTMAEVYTEPGPEGEPNRSQNFGEKCYRALGMLKAAYADQEEKRAAEAERNKQPGALVLDGTISVRGPLKLKASQTLFNNIRVIRAFN